MKKRIFTVVFLIVLGAILWLGFSTSRAGYESAEYKTIKKEGAFEIREYPELRTVSTATSNEGRDGGFMRLFKYITGENEGEQKIAMTTPVFMPSDADEKPQSMHFVLPKEVSENGAPDPSRAGVALSTFEKGNYAVIRFSGKLDGERRAKALQKLRSEITSRNLTAVGAPIYAGYDSPWTPGPLRRNEVLVKIKTES